MDQRSQHGGAHARELRDRVSHIKGMLRIPSRGHILCIFKLSSACHSVLGTWTALRVQLYFLDGMKLFVKDKIPLKSELIFTLLFKKKKITSLPQWHFQLWLQSGWMGFQEGQLDQELHRPPPVSLPSDGAYSVALTETKVAAFCHWNM